MKKRTGVILIILNVLAWITYIGLMIKAGAILFNYIFSFFVEQSPKNFFNGLNLYQLKQFGFWHYTAVVVFMLAIALLEVWTAHLIIKVLSRIKLKHPFTIEVSRIMEKISYFIVGIWIVAMLFNLYIAWLSDKGIEGLKEHMTSGDFIFLAGVIFVFAQIFKKGVEIQTENELTV